jgi:murein tripeptide amidase MpaA
MYRTVAQLDSLSSLLATWFPGYFTRITLPESSVQGRPVFALRLRAGGGEGERRGVLLVGGTHARELMNPDAIVELAVDLLVSHANGSDIVYGGKRWPASDIKLILETLDIWLVPCMNPDGRVHSMTVEAMWRKNRRDNPGTACDGVDLNRNFDVLWGVTQGQTSCSPCSDVYAGPSAFSEPETRNIKHLLDTRRIDCFADVHSYSELILWPWGHAPNQSADPSKRFTTLASGTCTGIPIAGYQEYLSARDQQRFQTVGSRIRDAIAAVRGRSYTNQPSVALYPTTGTQSDYVFSRHIADPNLRKTYGYTFETGPWSGSAEASFQPADPTLIKRDAKSGMIALMQQCICAIELIGIQFFTAQTEVDALRRVRDELLATTDAGREWVALFERVQTPLLGALMGDEALLAEAGELVKRAADLSRDDSEALTDEDVDRGIRVVRTLAKKAEAPEVRRDLRAVEARLESLRRQQMRGAVERLMNEKPHARRPTGPKAGANQATARKTTKTATKKAAAKKTAAKKTGTSASATTTSSERKPRKST